MGNIGLGSYAHICTPEVVRAPVLHKCYCISIAFNSSAGILYSTCCVLAHRKIYHSKGKQFKRLVIQRKHLQPPKSNQSQNPQPNQTTLNQFQQPSHADLKGHPPNSNTNSIQAEESPSLNSYPQRIVHINRKYTAPKQHTHTPFISPHPKTPEISSKRNSSQT
ncbi:hypothetical protein SO802_000381 [Lithocarpus litseifolius]|uniref:Uncharacterized protein n=1 Tax=Lithocarpus litseifolius TaxID=425828 RepID=A0AAW2DRF5_9ROSI